MRIIRAGAAAAVLASTLPTVAQTDLERFQLFTECAQMQVIVIAVFTEADSMAGSLTEESLRAAAESRLRAARLYADSVVPHLLSVGVWVYGEAFDIDIDFSQWLLNPDAGVRGWGRTWTLGGAGTHANQPGFMRNAVADYIDQFLAAYLRVNEAACQ